MKIYVLSRFHEDMDKFEILDNHQVLTSLKDAKDIARDEYQSAIYDEDAELTWEKENTTRTAETEFCIWQIKEVVI